MTRGIENDKVCSRPDAQVTNIRTAKRLCATKSCRMQRLTRQINEQFV